MQTSAAGCMIPLQTDGHIKWITLDDWKPRVGKFVEQAKSSQSISPIWLTRETEENHVFFSFFSASLLLLQQWAEAFPFNRVVITTRESHWMSCCHSFSDLENSTFEEEEGGRCLLSTMFLINRNRRFSLCSCTNPNYYFTLFLASGYILQCYESILCFQC